MDNARKLLPKAFATKTKTLQFRGWRTSIRLEGIFWEVLQALAHEQKSQLGPMVGSIASRYEGGNLSSYLRAACMLAVFKRLKTDTRSETGAFETDIIGMLQSAPSPGALVSSKSTIIDINLPMEDLLRLPRHTVVGEELGNYIRLSGGGSFNRFWGGLKRTISTHLERTVLLITPGRLSTFQMRSLRLGAEEESDPLFVIWLSNTESTADGSKKAS